MSGNLVVMKDQNQDSEDALHDDVDDDHDHDHDLCLGGRLQQDAMRAVTCEQVMRTAALIATTPLLEQVVDLKAFLRGFGLPIRDASKH